MMKWTISVQPPLRHRLPQVPVVVAGASPVALRLQAQSVLVVPEALVARLAQVALVVLSIPAVRNLEPSKAESPSVERCWTDLIGQVLISLSLLELRYL